MCPGSVNHDGTLFAQIIMGILIFGFAFVVLGLGLLVVVTS